MRHIKTISLLLIFFMVGCSTLSPIRSKKESAFLELIPGVTIANKLELSPLSPDVDVQSWKISKIIASNSLPTITPACSLMTHKPKNGWRSKTTWGFHPLNPQSCAQRSLPAWCHFFRIFLVMKRLPSESSFPAKNWPMEFPPGKWQARISSFNGTHLTTPSPIFGYHNLQLIFRCEAKSNEN